MAKRTFFLTAALLSVIGASAVETAALARGHRHHDRYERYDRRDRDRGYRGDCRTSGTTGLILGGAAGALLGRSIDTRGERTTGTVLGAAGGALLGKEIDSKRRC
jgi:outer membrane lipoprotein SlyB